MFIKRSEWRNLHERIGKLECALACYGELRHDKEYILSADKVRGKLDEIEARTAYVSHADYEHKHLTATEIMARFKEVYSILKVDRVQEPFVTLRPKA